MSLPTIGTVQTWRENAVEQLHDKVYDRYKLDNTLSSTEFIMFKTPVGTTRQGANLTRRDTNIESQQIPVNESWVLHGLNFFYTAAALRTSANAQLIFDFIRETYFAIRINGKDIIFEGTLDQYFGATQFILQPAATQNDNAPQAMFTGAMKFEVPIPLQRQTLWELVLIPISAAGINNDFLRIVFDREKLRLS